MYSISLGVCVSCIVVVLTSFVMCGCFGNMCTCIYCVLFFFTVFLYCLVYVYFILIYFVSTIVSTQPLGKNSK